MQTMALAFTRTYTPHGTQSRWGALCFYLVQRLEKKHVHLRRLGFFQHGTTRQTGATGGTNPTAWWQHRKPAATGRASAAGRTSIVRLGYQHFGKHRQRLCLSVFGKLRQTLSVPLRWRGLDRAASCSRISCSMATTWPPAVLGCRWAATAWSRSPSTKPRRRSCKSTR